MKLVTFSHGGRSRVGELVGNTIHPLAWNDTMTRMLRRGVIAGRTYEQIPLERVTIEAPLIPGKIIAIGLNYADHARETGKEPPDKPLIFAKFPSAVIGPNQTITWRTSITQEVDYEAELAVVIGKRGVDIREADAMQYVFGYTAANDVSARDLQIRIDSQWTRGKSLNTFCPLGPVLVTRDEIPDPHNLSIRSILNGEVMQDGNTGDMIFKIPYLIAYLSRHFTLEPGDIILTGTPAGVGRAKNPPRYLTTGDTITVQIERIGELSNPCAILPELEG